MIRAYLFISIQAVVVDSVLSPAVLLELRQFMQTTVMWHDIKAGAGFVGAYFVEGRSPLHPLFEMLKRDLRRLLPNVLGDCYISNMWAYSHTGAGHRTDIGVKIHADDGLYIILRPTNKHIHAPTIAPKWFSRPALP